MSLLDKVKGSEYAKNSSVLMVGTTVSTVIQAVSTLIYTQIYSDGDIGLYTLFNSFFSIFVIIATMRYEFAIMLPKDDNEAFNITVLSSSLAVGFGVLSFGILVILKFFTDVVFEFFAYIPISIMIYGIYISVNYWNNRRKKYKRLAINRIIQSVLFVAFAVLLSFVLENKSYGIIISYIMSQASVLVLLLSGLIKDYFKLGLKLDFKIIKNSFSKYKKFPIAGAPSGIINNLAVHAPVFLIKYFTHNDGLVGQYGIMQKILAIPIQVLGQAMADVFRQKAASDYNRDKNCVEIYNKTAKTLSLLALLPFSIIMVFSYPVISSLLPVYKVSAVLIIISSPLYYVKFIASPLSFMTVVLQKQFFDFAWQFAYFLFGSAAFLLGLWQYNIYAAVAFNSVLGILLYVISVLYTKKLSKGNLSERAAV